MLIIAERDTTAQIEIWNLHDPSSLRPYPSLSIIASHSIQAHRRNGLGYITCFDQDGTIIRTIPQETATISTSSLLKQHRLTHENLYQPDSPRPNRLPLPSPTYLTELLRNKN